MSRIPYPTVPSNCLLSLSPPQGSLFTRQPLADRPAGLAGLPNVPDFAHFTDHSLGSPMSTSGKQSVGGLSGCSQRYGDWEMFDASDSTEGRKSGWTSPTPRRGTPKAMLSRSPLAEKRGDMNTLITTPTRSTYTTRSDDVSPSKDKDVKSKHHSFIFGKPTSGLTRTPTSTSTSTSSSLAIRSNPRARPHPYALRSPLPQTSSMTGALSTSLGPSPLSLSLQVRAGAGSSFAPPRLQDTHCSPRSFPLPMAQSHSEGSPYALPAYASPPFAPRTEYVATFEDQLAVPDFDNFDYDGYDHEDEEQAWNDDMMEDDELPPRADNAVARRFDVGFENMIYPTSMMLDTSLHRSALAVDPASSDCTGGVSGFGLGLGLGLGLGPAFTLRS